MVFGPNTATKVLTCEYKRLRAIGLVDQSKLTEEEKRYADIRPNDGLGADNHDYSTSRFQAPYDPDCEIVYDTKCEDKLKGGKGHDRRRR